MTDQIPFDRHGPLSPGHRTCSISSPDSQERGNDTLSGQPDQLLMLNDDAHVAIATQNRISLYHYENLPGGR